MKLKNKNILMYVADEFEDLELFYPRYRMIEEGANVVVAGVKENEIYNSKHKYPCRSDISFDKIDISKFDGLIIPGGYAPDKLRKLPKVLEVTKQFHDKKKLIAFICHAGWIPVSAKIIKGITCTSYETIKDDMINAGANWVNEKVVVDHHFISSRCPDDLPYFCSEIIKFLE